MKDNEQGLNGSTNDYLIFKNVNDMKTNKKPKPLKKKSFKLNRRSKEDNQNLDIVSARLAKHLGMEMDESLIKSLTRTHKEKFDLETYAQRILQESKVKSK